ncbi:hypothetical protein [Rhodohalobacter sp. 614A]|uniref:hypothetical protein n=1 Tax=Rhodohalobacter sp. 614A TaxID=2908649 RepID=UPI001F441B52|nr:hypothetical protein [Rhodohalobacter sp. 614A]
MKFRFLVVFFFILLSACQSAPQLQEGFWTGSLTPMNHPEMSNPMGYEVSYIDRALTIHIVGPDSSLIPTDNTRIENDTLFFQFIEPEERVTLDCALAQHESAEQGFSGRCTDQSGKWARFTMIPPNH